MRAANYDIYMEQGATFRMDVRWTDSAGIPQDLGPVSIGMMLRATKDSSTAIISGFYDHELDTPTGDIEIIKEVPYSLGVFRLQIDRDITTLLTFNQARYDLETHRYGETFRLLEGPVFFSKEVTRGAGVTIPVPPPVAVDYLNVVRERGSGVLAADVPASTPIALTVLCGITSYWSNYGGAGVDSDSEGFWMDVLLDGVFMAAGEDYREHATPGTGATHISFLYPLHAGMRISVAVRRL